MTSVRKNDYHQPMANRISWISPVLNALESISGPHWSYPQKNAFYFNRFKKKRLLSEVGVLRFFLPNFSLHVPKDAEIYLRPEKNGVIVVAPKEKKVLKLFLDKISVEQLDREIEVLKKVRGTEFEPYTNKFIESGSVGEGRWLLVEFMQQEKPIDENYLFEHARSVMDKMGLFYKVYGTKMISASSWLKDIDKDIQKHPKASDLFFVKDLIKKEIEKVGDVDLVISTLHADLHKENIMLTKDGEKIFDWEGTCESLVLMDYFDFFRRHQTQLGKTTNILKEVLKNDHFFSHFRSWYKLNFGIELGQEKMRLLFLIYALDRTCSLMRLSPPRYTKEHLYEMKMILAELNN